MEKVYTSLLNNLKLLIFINDNGNYNDDEKKEIKRCLGKLKDAVEFSFHIERRLKEQTEQLTKEKTKELAKNAEEETKRLIEEHIKQSEKNYITILGIFAAIIMTIVSGLVYSSSVLEHMHTVGPYRLIAVIGLIGIVTFNVLYVFFYFIKALIFESCEDKNGCYDKSDEKKDDCPEKSDEKKSIWDKFKRRLSVVGGVNSRRFVTRTNFLWWLIYYFSFLC